MKISKIFSLFCFISLSSFLFGQTISQNVSCANALSLCNTSGFTLLNPNTYQYQWNLTGNNCSPSIAPMYFALPFSQNGNMSFSFQGDVEFVLHGPINGSTTRVCEAVNSYEAPYVTGSLDAQQNSYNFNYEEGVYILQVIVSDCQSTAIFSGEMLGANLSCDQEVACLDCITSFQPSPGKYIISAWVKEENAPIGTTQYDNTSLAISFANSSLTFQLSPTGAIIDGWQRIEGEVFVPNSSTNMDLTLQVAQGSAYFDDIRFFPFDGSMMSYVYDPESLRLMAELDERNYATFYEYDEEGKLIRVKKETEKGVMTIQENRDNIRK